MQILTAGAEQWNGIFVTFSRVNPVCEAKLIIKYQAKQRTFSAVVVWLSMRPRHTGSRFSLSYTINIQKEMHIGTWSFCCWPDKYNSNIVRLFAMLQPLSIHCWIERKKLVLAHPHWPFSCDQLTLKNRPELGVGLEKVSSGVFCTDPARLRFHQDHAVVQRDRWRHYIQHWKLPGWVQVG